MQVKWKDYEKIQESDRYKQDKGWKTKQDTQLMSYYGETEIENFTPRYFPEKDWPLFLSI